MKNNDVQEREGGYIPDEIDCSGCIYAIWNESSPGLALAGVQKRYCRLFDVEGTTEKGIINRIVDCLSAYPYGGLVTIKARKSREEVENGSQSS